MPLSPVSTPAAEPPAAARAAVARTFSVAIAGSGGAGVMTAGTLLLDAAARAGLYGLMVRTSGPQIRGGEAAALLRLGPQPVATLDDRFDLLLAIDWQNLHRFADEIPLGARQPAGRRQRRRRSPRSAAPQRREAARAGAEEDRQGQRRRLGQHDRARPGRHAGRRARGGAGSRAARELEAQRRIPGAQPGGAAAGRGDGAGPARRTPAAAAGHRPTRPPAAGCCPATKPPAAARCAAACASSPPTRSPRPPNCWNGWRPRSPRWAARCCRPRTNWPR